MGVAILKSVWKPRSALNQEGTYRWVQDRLKDLYAGRLSEHDRMRLQEISKEDPFIADALEGYELHAHHDHTTRLNSIAHRIRKKTYKRRPLLISQRNWILQAAAACLILLIATWAVMHFIEKEEAPVLVANEPKSIPGDNRDESVPDTQNIGTSVLEEEGYAAAIPKEESGLRANAQSRIERANNRKEVDDEMTSTVVASGVMATITDNTVQEAAKYGYEQEEAHSKTLSSNAADVATREESPAATQDHDAGLYANALPPQIAAQQAIGTVTASGGQPLYGASLSVVGTNITTQTDERGRFSLFLPEQESVIDVYYSGYVDTSVKLHQGDDDIVIVLPEQQQPLDQVAVQSKGLQPYMNVPAERAYKATRPKQGSDAFAEYLRKNSRIPLQENPNLPGRRVTLEFGINTNGRPDNIRVAITSGDIRLDDEAVRLMRRGPDWECEMDMYPCGAQYTVFFR